MCEVDTGGWCGGSRIARNLEFPSRLRKAAEGGGSEGLADAHSVHGSTRRYITCCSMSSASQSPVVNIEALTNPAHPLHILVGCHPKSSAPQKWGHIPCQAQHAILGYPMKEKDVR